jgi:hypothetical protein
MVAVAVVYILFQTIRVSAVDPAVAEVLMVPRLLAGQHLHLARVMLAVLVSAINPEMPEFPVVVVAQVL